MANEEGPKPSERVSWWQTTSGAITAITAIITAVTGLIAALTQAGLLGNKDTNTSPPPAIVSESSPPLASLPTLPPVGSSFSNSVAAPPASNASVPTPTTVPAPASGGASTAPSTVYLPSGDEVTVEDAVYKILSARLDNQAGSNANLQLAIRSTSQGENWVNFSANAFRLVVDGVPRAPTKSVDVYVAPRSAQEGDVIFSIPKSAATLILQIHGRNDTVEIPLSLKAGSGSAAPPAAAVSASGGGLASVALPSGDQVTVEDGVFKILSTQVDNQAGNTANLQFSVRVTSQGESWINFSANAFRLVVDGVPRAPTKSVDVYVAPRSAQEGDVVFAIPKTVKTLALQVHGRTDTLEIPLSVTPK